MAALPNTRDRTFVLGPRDVKWLAVSPPRLYLREQHSMCRYPHPREPAPLCRDRSVARSWTIFCPLKQSGTFMPTLLKVGPTTAGVPRHYTHSYERCRTPHPSLPSPQFLSGKRFPPETPPHATFVMWREAPVPIPMTPVRSSCAAAAKVFAAVVGEPLPRSFDGVATSIILCIAECSGFNCVAEDSIAGRSYGEAGCCSGRY